MHVPFDDMQKGTEVNLSYPMERLGSHKAWKGHGATRHLQHSALSPRSYWIPGSYAPALSEKRNSFLMLLKNKGFKEERRTKIGLYAIGKSMTLESNKSHT